MVPVTYLWLDAALQNAERGGNSNRFRLVSSTSIRTFTLFDMSSVPNPRQEAWFPLKGCASLTSVNEDDQVDTYDFAHYNKSVEVYWDQFQNTSSFDEKAPGTMSRFEKTS
ncbi:hypothetical protein BLNAU_15633 [Blattamonas nauphoetae]|uniref:Uncharacterized protein n=1 Tax=Blattamonas nauphoetae TaxID=2049346 RepID=A0ABQ9XFN1_9EUKA|nr:hypothetical protein BLNAU_15633 [Blattamonas nauphoetae]